MDIQGWMGALEWQGQVDIVSKEGDKRGNTGERAEFKGHLRVEWIYNATEAS